MPANLAFSVLHRPPCKNEHRRLWVTDLQDSDDEKLDAPSSVEARMHEYHARVNEEGEMSDTEALEVDQMLLEQETEDDKFWKVCSYCMQITSHMASKVHYSDYLDWTHFLN